MMLGFDRGDARIVLRFFVLGLRDRYLGSRIGMLWAVLNPLLMLGTFALIFGFVFRTRLPGSDSTFSYVVWLVAGYGPWLAFTDSVTSAANSLVANSGIVKNVAMKTEVLPISASLYGAAPLMVSCLILAVLLVADGNLPTWHSLALLVVVPILFALVAATGLFLSAVTAFYRDLVFALPNLLMLLLFATPVLYPIESAPALLQRIAVFNPLYQIIEAFRGPILRHELPTFWSLAYPALLATVLGFAGLALFRRMKGYFSAVL
jgi:lipopolysaccharide transport system permease protein